ncbi:hypothetical protein [Pseudomonas sp. KNUC1026]|uniref:hypothetical protein n=1 Tax=Pseudomonas sp. KNUC1026 TaxID=2893890 RepID=UPI001F1E3613|nr:hypothetical protein [Pseudomonas sp. KNUC1026]UFH50861.1 hypothetical protein LN139_07020 [Pseudomonas sp. KNUC1026]
MTDTPTEASAAPDAAEAQAPSVAQNLPWSDVQPEYFQLLRLLPLPTDRSVGPRPLRFVQWGNAERHNRHHSLLRMDIQLTGQRVRSDQNRLDVWVDHEKQIAWCEPPVLNIEPINRGLGRFMLAQAAGWLHEQGPNYRLQGQDLPARDGLVEDTRKRRDHVLRSHGLEVAYADPQFMKASYAEVPASELVAQWNPEKVQLVTVLDAANMLQLADQQMQEQEAKLRNSQEQISQYRREDGSLRFTIVCLIAFAVFQAGLLIWIATRH